MKEKFINKKFIVALLATGFGLGYLKPAPGTWGTLLGVPLAILLVRLGPSLYMLATCALILCACVVAEIYERQHGGHDHKEIVIDEVVGYLVAFTWLPMTWQSLLCAFVVFRIFDILKPGPIRTIDRRVKGGLGTVLDDVAAGLASNIVLQAVYTMTPWLGVQLISV